MQLDQSAEEQHHSSSSLRRSKKVDVTTVGMNMFGEEEEEESTSSSTRSSSMSYVSISPDTPIYHHPHVSFVNTSREDQEENEDDDEMDNFPSPLDGFVQHHPRVMMQREEAPLHQPLTFEPQFFSTKLLQRISRVCLLKNYSENENSTWIGFWALWSITCANYVLTPMRDAVALAVGVSNLPRLTLISTVLAFVSSVPIGWLFEAPDPKRRKLWKRLCLTRGETQGTSLALFYRCFMISILSYALGFSIFKRDESQEESTVEAAEQLTVFLSLWSLIQQLGQFMYIAFFLVVHLMKLHSLSLIWGVTTETMEYEDFARKRLQIPSSKTRLERLAFIGFGGTLGGILGSVVASSLAHVLKISGLLVVAACLLELSAELSIELGRIMQKHWEAQQTLFKNSADDLASLDPSMKRSHSLGCMKRVASGNSLHRMHSVKSLTELAKAESSTSLEKTVVVEEPDLNDDTFTQRLLRGVTTILRSRLLMAIFTYNALYASSTVLLSFQRAALVVSRNDASSSTESNTAFLANINMASSVAVFILQASGLGALLAKKVGSRGTLSLMPLIRLLGVLGLAWWHQSSNGQPPNLLLFLLLDECCRVMNLAVAKPVRESLWRGLSNEARYEAKPIVDTLANRWGGGSAAFLVACTDKFMDLSGMGFHDKENGTRSLFGYPPVLFLCVIIAAWWAMVSADLGHIRRKIDLELKKHQ